MGCASSKTTTAAEAPTLLTSGPQVHVEEKVAVQIPTDGKSADTTASEDVIGDKAMANANEAPTAGEPAPEPKTNDEASAITSKVADATADEPVKVTLSQTEAEEARGISVGGGCCGIGGGAHVGFHGCSLNFCGLGGNIHVRDAIDKDEIVVAEDTEARGISVGGGCCGLGGGAHVGCHGCGFSICGLGGNVHVRETVDEDEMLVKDNAEARGISVGGGCCGIGGGAHVGCHDCGFNFCGLGANIHVRDTVDEDEILVKDDAEARGISVGGGCCGIDGGAHVGRHGCSLNFCGLGGKIHVRDAVDKDELL
jgi:hypothetical protein